MSFTSNKLSTVATGNTIVIELKMSSSNGVPSRVGDITFNYNKK